MAERQLYESGYEGWGHSFAGYATDYVIAAVCGLCTWQILRKQKTTYPARVFCIYAVFQGVSFGFGGASHHLLDICWRNGELMGRKWSDNNSVWMYTWVLAVCGSPLANVGAVVLILGFSGQRKSWMFWFCGALVSIYEAFIILTAQVDFTGVLNAYMSIVMTLVGTVISGVEVCRSGYAAGRLPLFIGTLFLHLAFVFLAIGIPKECYTTGSIRRFCPYPEIFPQNAWFHMFIIASVLHHYVAVLKYPMEWDEVLSGSSIEIAPHVEIELRSIDRVASRNVLGLTPRSDRSASHKVIPLSPRCDAELRCDVGEPKSWGGSHIVYPTSDMSLSSMSN